MAGKGGGGAWKVAYADFVTAMMALFMVLWLTSQDTKIKEAVERSFRNPFSAVNKESTGIIPSSEKDAAPSSPNKSQGNFNTATAIEMEMMRHITEDIAKMLEQSQEMEKAVQLDLTPEGIRINVFDRTQKPVFEPGTDVFTQYGSWVFTTLAWEISRYTKFRIELEGHTEAQMTSGREAHSKWELSAERANAARRKLVSSGVVPGQVWKVSGFADTQPMENVPPTSEANRRVTVMLRMKSGDALGSTNTLASN